MEKVIMPKRLTAENGAKTALIGEFKESIIVTCANCCGDGADPEDCDETCEDCGGSGSYSISVPVQWTTIKEIYEKAVELLGEKYDHQKTS